MATAFKKSFRPIMEMLETREVPAQLSLSGGLLRITGSNNSDTMVIRQDNVAIRLQGGPAYYNSAVQKIVIDAKGGNDLVDLRTVRVPCIVYGGDGDDILVGGNNNDVL